MKFQETTRSVSVICHYVSDLSEYDLSLLAFKVQIAYFFIFFSFLGCNSLTSFQCMIIICLIGCSVGILCSVLEDELFVFPAIS